MVAAQIARHLDAPLDVVVARKIGHPRHPEYAIGAVSEDGFAVLNERETEQLDASHVQRAQQREATEAVRRSLRYRRGLDPHTVTGRTAILADDGVATGYTLIAAAHFLRSRQPDRLILAVPVGPVGALERLQSHADEFVCLATPEEFYAIGSFYEDFNQVADDTVCKLLREFQPNPA